MLIESSAPTRIDLGGGTLDIYPIYLFENGGVTVNIAIDLRSTVIIKSRFDKKILIESLDQNKKTWSKDYTTLKLNDELDLISRTIRFFKPKKGINVYTSNSTPKGSGLGSSSSLLIALCWALRKLNSLNIKKTDLITLASELETQNLGIPTGKQDYYAAVYGGVNAIWFNLGKVKLERLNKEKDFLEELEERIVLSYTGISRSSASTNWEKIKKYIDDKDNTRKGMENIKKTALRMRKCLIKGDLTRLGEYIKMEWENRKRLTKAVTNQKIEKLMLQAKKAGAVSSKLCGAGGGGCMITYINPDEKESVVDALQSQGAKILPYKIDKKGLSIRISKA